MFSLLETRAMPRVTSSLGESPLGPTGRKGAF